MKTKKTKCDVNHTFACTGLAVRTMTGVRKDDPVFKCCMGCETYLRRQGVRMKEHAKKRGK